MSNEELIIEAATALGLCKLAPQVYEDLLQPSVKEAGRNLVTIAKCVSVALTPLELTVYGAEQAKEWLRVRIATKLANKNPDDIQKPPLVVAGPLLLNYMFAAEEHELREMYANLLAAAMDKTQASTVHPSFVHVLQQISPDEAKILDFLKSEGPESSFCMEIEAFSMQYIDTNRGQFETICKNATVNYVDQSQTYMDNLTRLRIFAENVETNAELIERGCDERGEWDTHVNQECTKCIYITEFGFDFINACVR